MVVVRAERCHDGNGHQLAVGVAKQTPERFINLFNEMHDFQSPLLTREFSLFGIT